MSARLTKHGEEYEHTFSSASFEPIGFGAVVLMVRRVDGRSEETTYSTSPSFYTIRLE